jgi:hypothetical protein
LSVGGRELAQFPGPAPVGANRKILVATGFAAERGDAKEAPEEGKRRVHVFGRDALQFWIATKGTVGAKRVAQWHKAGIKSRLALGATPGIDVEEAEEIIHCRVAA